MTDDSVSAPSSPMAMAVGTATTDAAAVPLAGLIDGVWDVGNASQV